MEVWTQASLFIWCLLTHRRQLTQHSHRVRFWHLTTVPMARLYDSHSNERESTSLPSWFLHMTLLFKATKNPSKNLPLDFFLCVWICRPLRGPFHLAANLHFLGAGEEKKQKTVRRVNVSDDAYICMQIVLRALQASAESHSSPVFLESNHKLSVHYSWQETEANEGLMHSRTYA